MGLQPIVDSFGGLGGKIQIGRGTYYGDPLNPTADLVLPSNVEINGVAKDTSIIGSPVLMQAGNSGLSDLAVRPPGAAFGVKIYNGGSPFISRCYFRRVLIGASFKGAGDGPVLGLVLDGAGVLYAEQMTIASCTSHGLLADSTGSEPNTTLKFDSCTFNLNGGYGVRLLQSLTIAEFNGGNMEDNDLGEVYCEAAAGLFFRGVDFERGPYGSPPVTPPSVADVIEMENCNTIVIEGCNFLKVSSVTRAIGLGGCAGGVIEGNRFEGWGTNGIFRVGETCKDFRVGENRIHSGNGWIEDYSR
jgi:hypothetical protein